MSKTVHYDERAYRQSLLIPQTSVCTCCGSTNTLKSNIVMAGFVLERMLDQVQLDDWLTDAIQCRDCQYIASVFRFNDEQMKRYYHEYMDSNSDHGRQFGSYVFHRCRNEGMGWYQLAKAYQMPEYFQARKNAVIRSIADHVDIGSITSVLDYGGDLGQYIPEEFKNCRRHVVEIEPRKLVDGVIGVQSPADCESVDLVMCCHTLEHVSYPNELMADMLHYLKPGGVLYLEVPNEIKYVEENSNQETPMRMHEHINIFSPDSLREIMRRNGVKPLQIFDLRYDTVYKDFSPAFGAIGIKI